MGKWFVNIECVAESLFSSCMYVCMYARGLEL